MRRSKQNARGDSVKLKSCCHCKTKFAPVRPLQKVCSPICALEITRTDRNRIEKVRKSIERKADAVKRDKLKSRSDWAREAQAAVNRYVRLRDMAQGRGCVTCGAHPAQKRGGTMDAGHFRSVGSAPHLRYYLPQIALQCVTCNRHQGGRALDFRRALVERHGATWVEALESMQGLAKFDIDYLSRLKRIFTKKARRVEKRMRA